MSSSHFRSCLFLSLFLSLLCRATSAREPDANPQTKAGATQQTVQEPDPLTRPRGKTDDAKATREKESKHYRDWEREVQLIITPEELSAFRKLGTDAERDNFIEFFWRHRNPKPDSEVNEYKEEFYRRKAYANEHFSAGIQGEFTDRGRIYILWGPPDAIEAHPMGGPYLRPAEDGGGTTETYPFEIWRYRHLEGVRGEEVTIDFVDMCGCGEYRKTLNKSEKDAMKNVPNAGQTDAENLGLANKADRLRDPEGIGRSLFNQNSKFFERQEQDADLLRPPALPMIKAASTHVLHDKLLPFDVRVDFVMAPMDMVLMPITVQVPNRELTFVNKEGIQRGLVSISGQMTTLTGQLVQTFEDSLRLDLPAEALDSVLNNGALYWKALPMRPGRYKLDIVVKDMNGGKLGIVSRALQVPEYSRENLDTSSLILADVMQPVASTEVGSGNFVIGATKVRPRVAATGKPASFQPGQQINLWMQVYNLGWDEITGKPAATIEYQLTNVKTNQAMLNTSESADALGNSGNQLTLLKTLSLSKLEPGEYQVTVKVIDRIQGREIVRVAPFTVE